MRPFILTLIICFGFRETFAGQGRPQPQPKLGDTLPRFNAFRKYVTLSGFSSGGVFAQMMQFAHSSLIFGVAVFSDSYYRCGLPNGRYADYNLACTKLVTNSSNEKDYYDPDLVHTDIREYAQRNLIDDPANLKGKPLYVYVGLSNSVFNPEHSLGIVKVYQRYIKNPKKIKVRVQNSEMILPSNDPSLEHRCKAQAWNDPTFTFVAKCGLNGHYEALKFLLTSKVTIIAPKAKHDRTLIRGLRSFNQGEFLQGLRYPQMDRIGYYYMPEQCRYMKCMVHFYFHGCSTGRGFLGNKHILDSGLLDLAETNGIIMIFPQAVRTPQQLLDEGIGNPSGCWDIIGASGPNYATKKGDQIQAVRRMIDRVLGGPREESE